MAFVAFDGELDAPSTFTPFTGELDAAPTFVPFDGKLDSAKPQGFLSSVMDKLNNLGTAPMQGDAYQAENVPTPQVQPSAGGGRGFVNPSATIDSPTAFKSVLNGVDIKPLPGTGDDVDLNASLWARDHSASPNSVMFNKANAFDMNDAAVERGNAALNAKPVEPAGDWGIAALAALKNIVVSPATTITKTESVAARALGAEGIADWLGKQADSADADSASYAKDLTGAQNLAVAAGGIAGQIPMYVGAGALGGPGAVTALMAATMGGPAGFDARKKFIEAGDDPDMATVKAVPIIAANGMIGAFFGQVLRGGIGKLATTQAATINDALRVAASGNYVAKASAQVALSTLEASAFMGTAGGVTTGLENALGAEHQDVPAAILEGVKTGLLLGAVGAPLAMKYAHDQSLRIGWAVSTAMNPSASAKARTDAVDTFHSAIVDSVGKEKADAWRDTQYQAIAIGEAKRNGQVVDADGTNVVPDIPQITDQTGTPSPDIVPSTPPVVPPARPEAPPADTLDLTQFRPLASKLPATPADIVSTDQLQSEVAKQNSPDAIAAKVMAAGNVDDAIKAAISIPVGPDVVLPAIPAVSEQAAAMQISVPRPADIAPAAIESVAPDQVSSGPNSTAKIDKFYEAFPLNTPKGMSREELRIFIDGRKQARTDLLAELDPQADGLVLPGLSGFNGISEDARPDGKAWRVTNFDENMTPTGHDVYDTKREALDSVISSYQIDKNLQASQPQEKPNGPQAEKAIAQEPGQQAPAVIAQPAAVEEPISNQGDLKTWFGASKAADANGQPMVMYRGSHEASELKPNPALGGLIFFTPDANQANAFATAQGANVMPVYIKAEHPWPKIVHAADEASTAIKAKAAGYDSIRVRDSNRPGEPINWAVFDASQVRSVFSKNATNTPQAVEAPAAIPVASGVEASAVTPLQAEIAKARAMSQAAPVEAAPAAEPAPEIFKNKTLASIYKKKYQPQGRVVKVDGGFSVIDRTDAQRANDVLAGKRRLNSARATSYETNPFLTFLATHGLYHVKDEPRSQQTEFSPDHNPMIAGYGPIFKRTGMMPDVLAPIAAEEGYLPPGSHDATALHSLISRALRGERIAPIHGEGQAEIEANRRMPRLEDMPDDLNPINDLDYTQEDEDNSGYSAAPTPIKLEVNALLALAESRGIDTDTITEKAYEDTRNGSEQDYLEASRGALQAAIEASNGDSSQNAGAQGRAPDARVAEESPSYGLTTPTREDVLAQQAQRGETPTTVTPAQIYEDASKAHRVATATFRKISDDYGAQKIGDTEFLAGRAAFDRASKNFDDAERTFVTSSKKLKPVENDLFNPQDSLFEPQPNYGEDSNFKRWSNDAPLITSVAAATHEFKTGDKVALEGFHGAGRADRVGTVFQRNRATSGPMAFFTSSPDLASGYATGKADTSRALEDNAYETWFKFKAPGDRSTTPIDRAWYRLTPEQRATIRERMPDIRTTDDGDIIYEKGGGDIGAYEWNLKETQRGFEKGGNPLKAAVETWLNSGAIYDNEQEFMQVLKLAGFPVNQVEFDHPHETFPSVFKVFIAMQKPLVTNDIPADVVTALDAAAKRDRSRAQSVGADMWDKNTRTLREWVENLNDPENNNASYVWTSIPDKVTDVLKSLGYDGIIDKSGKGGGAQHPVYIPFEETQVKSAIGNNGNFDRSKKNFLKEPTPEYGNSPTWRSALKDGIDALNVKAQHQEGWRAQIQGMVNKGAVKADEVQWSGVTDWLQLQTGRVTKEQVSDFLKNNGVQVKETVLKDNGYSGEMTVGPINRGHYDEWAVFDQEGRVVGDTRYKTSEEATDAAKEMDRTSPPTKYSMYQLPGGERYREVLLTLPEKPIANRDEIIAAYRSRFPDTFADDKMILESSWVRDHIAAAKEGNPNFKSNHWEQPNVLAHIRLNDRWTSADGTSYTPPEKVLFVEEIQADKGQEWQKLKGKIADGTATDADKTRFELLDKNFPFNKTDAWVSLALKRIIKLGVDEGYDKVAFINGEQSAQRYDLSKQINLVSALANGDGTYNLVVEDKNGREVGDMARSGKKMTPQELEDTIGKDLAKKLIDGSEAVKGKPWPKTTSTNPAFFTLRGLDLKVGGRGMVEFYDRLVPNITKEVLRKLGGGQLTDVTLDTQGTGLSEKRGYVGPEYTSAQLMHSSMRAKIDNATQEIQLRDVANAIRAGSTFTEAMNANASIALAEKLGGKMEVLPQVLSKQTGFAITDAMREHASKGMAMFEPKSDYNQFRGQLDLFLNSRPDPSQAGTRPDMAGKGIAVSRRDAAAEVENLYASPSVLGQAMSRDLAARQRTSLVGQTITDHADLAALSQVYRNPFFESFRVVFTDKNDKVISQVGLTNRLPGSTSAFIGPDRAKYVSDLANIAKNAGATSYYLTHNHPSSNVTPSAEDERMTRDFRNDFITHGLDFKGHVVIDTNEYAFINRRGESTIFKKDFGAVAPMLHAEFGNYKITGPADIMRMAKQLEVDKDGVTLIVTDRQFQTKAITILPSDAISSNVSKTRLNLLKAIMRDQGVYVFAVSRNEPLLRHLGGMIADGVYVARDGSMKSLRSLGVIPSKGAFPESRRTRITPDTSPEFAYLRQAPQAAGRSIAVNEGGRSADAVRAGDVFRAPNGEAVTVTRALPGGKVEVRIQGNRTRLGDFTNNELKAWEKIGRADYADGAYTTPQSLIDLAKNESTAPQSANVAEPKPEYKAATAADKIKATEAVKSRLIKQGEERTVPTFISKVRDSVTRGFDELKNAYVGTPKFTDSKRIIGQYLGEKQEIDFGLSKFAKKINLEVSKPKQEAITQYMQAGGDEALLRQRADDVPAAYKKAFEDAITLSPEEKAWAKTIRAEQDKWGEQAVNAGILEHLLDNYVRGQWDRENPVGKKLAAIANSGELNAHPKEAMKKIFQTYYDGIKLGYVPTDMRIGFQHTAAQRSIQGAIAAKKALTALMSSTEADGRPTVAVGGAGSMIEKEGVEAKSYFVKPNVKGKDTQDYRYLDHPALRSWKWVGSDADGKPILMHGNMYIHPDAWGQINALLGRSLVREWAVPKTVPVIGGTHPGDAMLKAGAWVKATILNGTPFHQFHLGEHAVFHKVNPLDTPEIDFEQRPLLREGISHGLMLFNHNAMQEFGEGLGGGGGLLGHVPYLGAGIKRYGEYLFQDYIPRLKAMMFERAFTESMLHEKANLESGKITRDQLLERTALQSNAAFGEMNYKYMGRNKTIQDLARLFMLAPDFLEARFKFFGQAMTPGGREQRNALIRGAIIMAAIAQVINLMVGDDKKMHWDKPFSVIIGGKEYSPRSVVGDMAHLLTDPRGFWYSRINPLWGRPLAELATGRDRFGRKETMEEGLKAIVKSWTPIMAQGFFKNTAGDTHVQSITNALLQSVGIGNYTHKDPAEKLISDIGFGHMTVAGKSEAQKARYSSFIDIKNGFMDGTLNSMDDVRAKARESNLILTKEQLTQIRLFRDPTPRAKQQLLEHRMRSFSADEVLQVFDKMDDDEKATYKPFVRGKIMRSRNMTERDKVAAMKSLSQ